jgi:predicted transcriptional regulator
MPAYNLGELEKEIMNILWDQQESTGNSYKGLTVQQVVKQIQNSRTLAYTTIATVLNRLHEKKIVLKKAEKNFHFYLPAISRHDYSSTIVHRFMEDFMHSFGDAAIPSFAGGLTKLKPEDREKLISLLESQKVEKNNE